MLITTTNSVEGHPIAAYLGIVNGETIAGINVLKDIGAGFRNVFGGRSAGYEDELIAARDSAIGEMEQRAASIGADAVVGFRFDYEVLGQGNMLMVVATGTAVRLS
ncbi:YbjQ family protein [Changpingibacter yushuensis]|uniref:YbjQ family protein n=1 Tax=Changpingibacter yushuensis TaxID=2758440 RepID=UPI00165D8F9F|nr:YbjQ family protein [Changpingibacter yushuensis]